MPIPVMFFDQFDRCQSSSRSVMKCGTEGGTFRKILIRLVFGRQGSLFVTLFRYVRRVPPFILHMSEPAGYLGASLCQVGKLFRSHPSKDSRKPCPRIGFQAVLQRL